MLEGNSNVQPVPHGRYTPNRNSSTKSNSRQSSNLVIKQQPHEQEEIQEGITFLRNETVEDQDILPLGIEGAQIESNPQPADSFSPTFDNANTEEENLEGQNRLNVLINAPTTSSQQNSPIGKQMNTCNKGLASKHLFSTSCKIFFETMAFKMDSVT